MDILRIALRGRRQDLNRIGAPDGNRINRQSLKNAAAVARLEPGQPDLEMADQIAQSIAVDILCARVAEREAGFIACSTKCQ